MDIQVYTSPLTVDGVFLLAQDRRDSAAVVEAGMWAKAPSGAKLQGWTEQCPRAGGSPADSPESSFREVPRLVELLQEPELHR